MSNDYIDGRRALQTSVTKGVRDAVAEANPEGVEPELFTDVDVAPTPKLPIDGISVRVDPTDRTSWLVTVRIPRHSLTDDEAQVIQRLED